MTPFRPGLLAVAAREVQWIFRDPVARFLLFGVPVIAFAVLGFTFSHAVVRGLGVVVVDMDNSATSQQFVQTVAAAPGIAVTERADDLGAATSAIRAGRAIAAVYLPPEFGKDLLARPCPTRRRIHQHAVFYPGEQCREEHSRWHIGRHRGCLAGAPGTGRPRRAGSRARGRRVCAVESRTELRAVPASRGAAHSAACRHRDLCGIRGRFRVPAAKHARLVGRSPVTASPRHCSASSCRTTSC